MDFWRDVWPTLIAPFIVLIFFQVAVALGNKIKFKLREGEYTWLDIINLFSLLTTVALGYILIQCVRYIFSNIHSSTLNILTQILYGFVIIIILSLICLVSYFFVKSGGDIETLENEIKSLRQRLEDTWISVTAFYIWLVFFLATITLTYKLIQCITYLFTYILEHLI